ncbi:MAG: GlcG/HbpS family heme-binding protein [Sphingomonadaceae bacterium]
MNLQLETAERITKAAVARAQQMGIRVAVAVVDEGGNLLHLSRMDGASFLAPDIATGKAVTAAAWRMPSAEVEKRAANRDAFFASVSTATRGRAVIGKGALPVLISGQVVGAVGASGGTSEEDEEVVKAGIAAVVA